MKISSFLRLAAAVCLVALLTVSLTSCFNEAPTAIITDEQNQPQTPDTPATSATTRPTVAVPEEQLTLNDLMGVMSESMKWSDISGFEHTLTDDTHATFVVADGYGKTCTLNAVFDAASDTLSQAELIHGDTVVNVLTNNTLSIRHIMVALDEE